MSGSRVHPARVGTWRKWHALALVANTCTPLTPIHPAYPCPLHSIRFSIPAVSSSPPGVNANEISLSVLGQYFFQPRCILPIGDMCNSDASKGTKKVKGKQQSRALRAIAGPGRTGRRLVAR